MLAIVFYLFSLAVGGEGSLGDTFKLNGWGFVPAIVAGIVTAIGQFVALQSVGVPDLPENLNEETAQQFTQALAEFTSALQSQPAVRIATLLAVLLTIWQAVIWVYATRHARNLSVRRAAIAVGIPVGLLVLFNLYSLLNGWVI